MVPIPVSKPTLFLQQHLSWYWYLLFNQSNRKRVIKYKPPSKIVQKQKTCCFLFQICFHLIDRLRNIFKKHNDMIFVVFPNAHKQNDMLFFLLFVISGDTENQPKSCPRRYPRWPPKGSWETSWEVPKTFKKSFWPKIEKWLTMTKQKLKKKRF